MPLNPRLRELLLLLMLAAAAVLLHGYHLGVQDGAIYLPAIKKSLNPGLYMFDAQFFLSQTQWMFFDEAVALFIRLTRLPLDWVMFLGHLLTVFLVLLACRKLSRKCFAEPAAQWAAVGMVAALLTLVATGTLLPIVDNYFHPRGLTTAALLFALPAALERKPVALLWVAIAAPLHPMMAAIGVFHLAVQAWKPPREAFAALLVVPFFALQGDEAWREVLATRRHFFLLQWTWYEWLGVIGPLAFLAWLARFAERSRMLLVAHMCRRLLVSSGVCVAAALVITSVPGLERFIVLQPMRALHLVYLLAAFFAGGLVGRAWLKSRPLRWAVFFVPLCAIVFGVQLRVFSGGPHIEWPGRVPTNAWVQAFDWARGNTPPDAVFALDPHHMELRGEDSHGFRAFAERSMLADAVKDRAVAALSPSLAATWREQQQDLQGWARFTREDFYRLQEKYGVEWVILERPGVPSLACPYSNARVMVCRIE